MSDINKTESVKQQYSDDKNLSSRMNLHLKHSTNKQGFFSWLWEQYKFFDNCRILELGCGNGAQWENRIDILPGGCNIILSDFSEGMVKIVREKYAEYTNFSFQQIDIQNIPFANETFDIVIANHMLYHVSDLTKALSEVKRVLKTDGKFYSSTNGERGMRPFLHNVFTHLYPETKSLPLAEKLTFTLQNGFEILSKHFSDVQKIDYEDSLLITETQDLLDWIKSTMWIKNYSEQNIDDLFDYFEDIRKKDGAIHIPKEAGLFISTPR